MYTHAGTLTCTCKHTHTHILTPLGACLEINNAVDAAAAADNDDDGDNNIINDDDGDANDDSRDVGDYDDRVCSGDNDEDNNDDNDDNGDENNNDTDNIVFFFLFQTSTSVRAVRARTVECATTTSTATHVPVSPVTPEPTVRRLVRKLLALPLFFQFHFNL
jgi:hypothetical protein